MRDEQIIKLLAESLIAARAAERHEVSPFFKTRVMAAIKERRDAAIANMIAGQSSKS